jgi:hypothetical protein
LFIGRYCTALPETNSREALIYSDFVAIRRCSQELSSRHHVGARLHKRILNVITDFRGVNQRMHDKTFIVDGIVGITGGRNMANEYFSYGRDYNFRDAMQVETLYDGLGLMQKNVKVSDDVVQQVYRELHAYAGAPENFAPEVRAAIENTPTSFPRVTAEIVWGDAEFIHDVPDHYVPLTKRGRVRVWQLLPLKVILRV